MVNNSLLVHTLFPIFPIFTKNLEQVIKKQLLIAAIFFTILVFPSLLKASQPGFPEEENSPFIVEMPSIIVQHIEQRIVIIPDKDRIPVEGVETIEVYINDELFRTTIRDGKIPVLYSFSRKEELTIRIEDSIWSRIVNPIPLWMSVLPPLIAILMALVFREVYTALFVGLLIGTSIISFYQGHAFFLAIGKGCLLIIDTYILDSLVDADHMAIIVFSMMIGATIKLITSNGGMKGVVNKLSRFARGPRSGQFVTWILGIAIFFDDYANTLVVGNTMRPVTDKLRISREKLAYIVDSTAAPITAIAFVTTWIGAELGYIQDGINTIGLDESAYNIFLRSLAYSFYPILTLLFILILVYNNREYGPMLAAERRARFSKPAELNDDKGNFSNQVSDPEAPEAQKARWFNAVIPIFVVVTGTVAGLFYTGLQEVGWSEAIGFSKNLSNVIGHADSYRALLWSSLSGALVALVMTLSQRLLTLKESVDSMISGFKVMLTAMVILIMAWSIALITKDMHTADFIAQVLVDINMTPYLIPTISFILSALVAFSTGSSWGTMAILYPLVLPSTWMISQQYGLEYDHSMIIFYNVVSTVLAGSVMGDHCSPISDTTILSSLASSCNHIEHVRTQLPYALTVGVVAILFGTLPAAYGVPSWILFPIGLAILYLAVRFIGKKV